MTKVTPFEVYNQYLSFKQHFTKESYDYFKYGGKTRASIKTFNKRKDRYFFEKISRQKSDEEIKNYFLSNFITEDASKIWIREIIHNGEKTYIEWQKRIQSMGYLFSEECRNIFQDDKKFDKFFLCNNGQHPDIFKLYLKKEISLETFVILDKILGFRKNFDKKIMDPVWETVSLLLYKYEPFLNIDITRYKENLKQIVSNG